MEGGDWSRGVSRGRSAAFFHPTSACGSGRRAPDNGWRGTQTSYGLRAVGDWMGRQLAGLALDGVAHWRARRWLPGVGHCSAPFASKEQEYSQRRRGRRAGAEGRRSLQRGQALQYQRPDLRAGRRPQLSRRRYSLVVWPGLSRPADRERRGLRHARDLGCAPHDAIAELCPRDQPGQRQIDRRAGQRSRSLCTQSPDRPLDRNREGAGFLRSWARPRASRICRAGADRGQRRPHADGDVARGSPAPAPSKVMVASAKPFLPGSSGARDTPLPTERPFTLGGTPPGRLTGPSAASEVTSVTRPASRSVVRSPAPQVVESRAESPTPVVSTPAAGFAPMRSEGCALGLMSGRGLY